MNPAIVLFSGASFVLLALSRWRKLFQTQVLLEKVCRVVLQQVATSEHRQVWIGLVGVPGAGKTTMANRVRHHLQAEHKLPTAVVSMDGYHYSRRELDRFPDPAEAHTRRGAPFTFDQHKFGAELELAKSVVRGGDSFWVRQRSSQTQPSSNLSSHSFLHSITNSRTLNQVPSRFRPHIEWLLWKATTYCWDRRQHTLNIPLKAGCELIGL